MDILDDASEPQNGLAVPGRGQLAPRKALRAQYSEISTGPYGYENPDEEPASGGLLDYWRILRRRKGTWVAFAVGFAVFGFLLTLPQAPVYQARTSVEVLGFNSDFMNMKEASPVMNSDGNYDTSEVQTQIKLLQSASVLNRAVARVKGSYVPSRQSKGLFQTVRNALHLPTPSPVQLYDAELKRAIQSMKAKATPQTRIIEMTIDSRDPRLAAEFANAITSEFIGMNLESRLQTTEKTSEWLSRQLDDMRKKLEGSEDALQAYARSSGLIFTEDKTSISAEKLRQVQQALSIAESERIVKQSRYEAAQHSPADSLPDVLNDPGMRDTRAKLTELRKQESDLVTMFTPEYAKVKRIQAQIKALETAFDHDRTQILSRIRDEYVEAARAEELLRAAYLNQTKVVSGEGEKSIQYSILKRDVESNRQLYETMLQQLKQSTIASAMHASNLRVVDPAEVPLKPYKPNPELYSAVGLLAGIFFGAVFIVLREQADRTIQQPGDAALYLNTPELGIIPSGQLDAKNRRNALLVSKAGSVNAGDEETSGLDNRIALATWQSKQSLVAESFRSTLISILFSGEGGAAPPQVVLLTSAAPAEGKSTVASNLAIATAEIGMKVLLIDADLRRPALHEIFNLRNERGLSTLLRERTSLNGDRSLGGLIRESEIPGLFILTSGPGISTATNLLYGPQMSGALGYFRQEFDAVFIDTPPMLHIPDARVLGRLVDRVILVVRAGQTTRDAAIAARQRFREDGSKMLGTILNDWNPKTSPQGYYNYKSYYHYSAKKA